MFNLFFSPVGRITRTWYWVGFLSQAALLIPLCFALYNSARSHDREAFSLLMLGGVAFLLWTTFCITAKRLHDHGKSAWVFALAFIPGLGLLLVAYCGFLPGDEGSNAYGAPTGASGFSGASNGKSWRDIEETDNSADIDAMIARSLEAKNAPPPSAPSGAMAMAGAGPSRAASGPPVFGKRR